MVEVVTLINIFRSNIRYYRYLKNYSQEKLGEMSGLSTHYISDVEKGKYSPTIPTIERIAEALEVPANVLFIDNPEAYNLASRIDIHRVRGNKKK